MSCLGGFCMRFKRLVPVVLAMFVVTATLAAVAQEKFSTQLIPREVLFGNPERTNPLISPDGAQLGYLAPSNGVMNVWVRTLGQNDDRVVTSDTKRGMR